MGRRFNRAYDALFSRKRRKLGSDLAHFVVPVVSLTILSATIGVNASDLDNSTKTTALVASAILGLCIFYVVMEVVWESVGARQIVRSLTSFLLAVGIAWIISPVIANLSGNQSLVDGVLYGWLISFAFVAVIARTDENTLIEAPSAERENNPNE